MGSPATLSLDPPTWLLTTWLFVYGVGVGFATAQLTSLLLRDVPLDESGLASGLQSVRQIGSALGVALLGGLPHRPARPRPPRNGSTRSASRRPRSAR